MVGLAHLLIEVGLVLFLGFSSPGPPSSIQIVPQARPLTVGVCFPRYVMLRRLGRQYDEKVIARGLSENDQIIMEIWVNRRTDTWSITLTDTHGRSCLVLSGEHYLGEPAGEAADRSPLPGLR